MLKSLILGILIAVVGIYIYISVTDLDDKSKKVSKEVQRESKILESDTNKVNDKKIDNKMSKVSQNGIRNKQVAPLVTNSEVLKNMYALIQKTEDWDAYVELFNNQVKELRVKGDYSNFYEEFKDFFRNNKLSISVQTGLLTLLTDTATEESIDTLFEIFDEDIVNDDEVNYDVCEHLARSSNWIKDDPSVDMKALVKALTKGYKTTDNHYLKEAAAQLLGEYETPETEVMLFRDYLESDTPEKKRAAYAGLMSMHGTAMLPRLRSYLTSPYEDVKTTAGMFLANMVTDDAIEVFVDWILVDAKMEDLPHIKEWLGKMMGRVGVSIFRKTINFGKIEPEEFRIELEHFIDEEQEKEKASVSSN